MEHLHNFLKEVQSLKIEIVKFHKLKDCKHVQDGKQGRRKVHDSYTCYVVPDNFTGGNGSQTIEELSNIAFTEVLLLTNDQQKAILTKCKIILSRIQDIDKGAKAIVNPNTEPSPLFIHNAIAHSFPHTIMPSGKPERSCISMLSFAIKRREYALAKFTNELSELIILQNKSILYSGYQPPSIKDPYVIIDCARYGLHYIYQLFNQQLKPEWVKPEDTQAGKVYSRKDMKQVRFVNSFQIAQELPFIDFAIFTNAVRRLLYNVQNKDELLCLLKELISSAKRNVELFQSKIEPLELLSRDIEVKELPHDNELRDYPVYSGVIKHLIIREDKRMSTVLKAGMAEFTQMPSEYYSNIRLAQYCDNVRVFLSKEALHEDAEGVEFSMSDDDAYIFNTVKEYLEPFKGAIREKDLINVRRRFYEYLKNGNVDKIKPVFVEKCNTVKLALACGKLCKALRPEGINYEFLLLLKNTFSIYSHMDFDKENFRKSPLYKHCTRSK